MNRIPGTLSLRHPSHEVSTLAVVVLHYTCALYIGPGTKPFFSRAPSSVERLKAMS